MAKTKLPKSNIVSFSDYKNKKEEKEKQSKDFQNKVNADIGNWLSEILSDETAKESRTYKIDEIPKDDPMYSFLSSIIPQAILNNATVTYTSLSKEDLDKFQQNTSAEDYVVLPEDDAFMITQDFKGILESFYPEKGAGRLEEIKFDPQWIKCRELLQEIILQSIYMYTANPKYDRMRIETLHKSITEKEQS